uniref:Uncharacterized protein n=1 Tax=Meloidogyne enterolobii TaxID=390850 RepID=A0A6V7X3B8_MELEN|nr:unnamed protein product [Meloidogyne enterolobii]
MKYTKKMILVPESEYHALLSLIKGGDYLQNEKVQTDSKIKQTLNDPNLREDVKAQKYNWLYKKRRQLKHELENRPQKVIIDEGNTARAPEVAPYLSDTAAPKAQLLPVQSSSEYQIDSELTSKLMKRRKTTPFKGIISKRYSKELENYVKDNAEKFRISKNGSFESNVKGRLVKNSNFTEVLEYVQGDIASPPKGFSFLFNRLSKDPLVKEMIKETQGESSTGESSGEFSQSSCFFVIPMTSTLEDTNGLELIRQGTTTVRCMFNQPVKDEGYEMIIMGEFDAIMSINADRVLSTDGSV